MNEEDLLFALDTIAPRLHASSMKVHFVCTFGRSTRCALHEKYGTLIEPSKRFVDR